MHRCCSWRMFRKHATRGKWAQPHRLAMNCSPVLDCSCSRASGVWGQRNTATHRSRSESIAERNCTRCNTRMPLHRCCSWRMPRKIKHIPTRAERAEQRRKLICCISDPERKQSRVLRSVPERGPRPNRDTQHFRVETHGIDVSYAARVTTYAMHVPLPVPVLRPAAFGHGIHMHGCHPLA